MKKDSAMMNKSKKAIQLSEHFTFSKLLRFSFPSIVMMVFTSIYGIVDGLFVSNLVGKQQFTALNLIFPVIMIAGAFGFMMGAGGTAIVAKTLGEKQDRKAKEYFSFITIATALLGITVSALGIIFMRPLAILLKADGALLDYCVLYGRLVLLAMPFFMLQNLFQSFFIVAEKPKLGLTVTLIAGITNMVLDALFMAVFKWGLAGAALATALSQVVGGTLPLIYFFRKNTSLLAFCKTRYYGQVLFKTVTNGSSELINSISSSIVTILYNYQLMRYADEDGVAAYGVLMYLGFIFFAIFIGYSIGTAPIVGFHYGAGNSDELKSVLKKSMALTIGGGAAMSVVSILLSSPLSSIFVGYDAALLAMTTRGMLIFSICFVFSGFSVFASSFFTALNNGPISAAISFLRTIVFQIAGIFILPYFFKLDGIWFSLPASDALALITTFIFIFAYRKRYKYL
jgi:putative MATE family efflux protein